MTDIDEMYRREEEPVDEDNDELCSASNQEHMNIATEEMTQDDEVSDGRCEDPKKTETRDDRHEEQDEDNSNDYGPSNTEGHNDADLDANDIMVAEKEFEPIYDE